ncbi:MAG: hypothetical protein NTZ05_07915, partial [Chloroflexi bacterium]|nr:hypothetical protein [Chloroflexota bacterium]
SLIFTCCHPAFNTETQVALTLRSVGGLTSAEIARAFLLPEPTLAQRLVRAKRKIRDAGIPLHLPAPHLWPERLLAVRAVIYLIFNEGYSASFGADVVRTDLCAEAIRLGEELAALLLAEPEVQGLLALMLLHDARRSARMTADGLPVLLEHQDRTRWNRGQIAAAVRRLRGAMMLRQPGPYQLQAAIAAVHAEAPRAEDTDWRQILALYDRLIDFTNTPVIHLNRAVAVAMVRGPAAGLQSLDDPTLAAALDGYRWYHAARGDFLRRLDLRLAACAAYQRALDLTESVPDRRFLTGRMAEVAE